MRFCVRISQGAAVGDIIFFKAGRIFSPGCGKPGLKNTTFSPGTLVPVGKPGLKPVPNRDYMSIL